MKDYADYGEEANIADSIDAKISAIYNLTKWESSSLLCFILGANLGIELLDSNMTEIIKQRNESIQQTINNLWPILTSKILFKWVMIVPTGNSSSRRFRKTFPRTFMEEYIKLKKSMMKALHDFLNGMWNIPSFPR